MPLRVTMYKARDGGLEDEIPNFFNVKIIMCDEEKSVSVHCYTYAHCCVFSPKNLLLNLAIEGVMKLRKCVFSLQKEE
jgi:hypothetical protein